ncbi:MAG: hypothetical protein IPN53_07010 [Comamonadaceae bacterium]|nr:hypothetical protein [Comamonadaceae bacterium]
MTATATGTNLFTGWSGDCTSTGTCSVSMSAAKNVTANFAVGYALTISKTGTGTGSVSSSPTGIDCGSTCSANFASGTVITLSPVVSGSNLFTGWNGACTGTGACSVTMSAAKASAPTLPLNLS